MAEQTRIYYKRPHHPDDPMWVIGCIDSYGAIHARHTNHRGSVMHGPNESKGKRFRWNIWAQDFHSTLNPTLDRSITKEEWDIITNWLERKGYKKPEE